MSLPCPDGSVRSGGKDHGLIGYSILDLHLPGYRIDRVAGRIAVALRRPKDVRRHQPLIGEEDGYTELLEGGGV